MINPRKQKRVCKIFSGDFETTVYKNQDHTEVWAAACVEIYTEDVQIFHSIDELYNYFVSLNCNICCYFHNLKFDGSFWIPFLLNRMNFKQAFMQRSESEYDVKALKPKEMANGTFNYVISDMGQWYSITIKTHGIIIELRDSLKLLPFSVKEIGKSFQTKHKKLDMVYKGFRYSGCKITEEERRYIANDVLVVKEALETMFAQGHDKLTIGSCCLSEFKSLYGDFYQTDFPDLEKIPLNCEMYGSPNADAYIRKSYKGGWCYLVPTKAKKRMHNGLTADVNSLYPSMMSSESGNRFPVGMPTFWKGNYLPVACKSSSIYYFVRIKCRFQIKPNRLPCIQIKSNFRYPANEWLTSSDVYNKKTKTYHRYFVDENGEEQDSTVILTLTCTDYQLIQEQYDLLDLEILDGCFFNSAMGIFDDYIEKYKKIKLESTGALRTLAKLFLNNLYGKFASSSNSSFKYAYLKDDKSLGFATVEAHEKKVGYIAIGSAITSYSRNFTIRAAQANYYGHNKRGFIYADTDSIHCDLSPEEMKGIKTHDKNFCCWKLEAQWDTAWFTRQKTYIEHVVGENLQPIENPYYNVKCAGMPDNCKDLLVKSMTGYVPTEDDDYTKEQLDFLKKKRDYEDFDVGLKIWGKLMPKRIEGGVILVDSYYTML